MSNYIKVYQPNDIEYQRLQNVCNLLNQKAKVLQIPAKYYLEDIYFDFGQHWMWTTICCDYKSGLLKSIETYQILYPAEYEKIVKNETKDIPDIIERLIKVTIKFTKREEVII